MALLSYKEWLVDVEHSATLSDPHASYLEYVNEWYDDTFDSTTTSESKENDYLSFLLTLKLITTDDDILEYIDNLNYSNDSELKTAIPYFAMNLRDIAKYISIRRSRAKTVNKNYGYLGSNAGLKFDIYRTLLDAYVSNSSLDSDDLLELIKDTSIEIEELYDDNEYMDKSPDIDSGDYFDMESNSEYYTEYDSDYLKWIVESGFNSLYSNNQYFNPSADDVLPLSGYIGYDESTDQVSQYKTNLSNTLMGEEHYYLSGSDSSSNYADFIGTYSEADTPWNNLSNRYFPTIATFPLIDLTYSKYDVGGFLIPSKLGMSVALGRNKYYTVDVLELQGDKDNFPDQSIYSNGYSFSRQYQNSPIVYNTYLNWIDIKQISGKAKGVLDSDGTYQEMIPYQTSQESSFKTYLGMNRSGDKTDPWYSTEDKIWEDDTNYPADFRNIYDINGWYLENQVISGDIDNWGIDIYGNNYGLYKDSDSLNFYERRMNSSGKVYVRNFNGIISTYSEYFNDSLGEVFLDFDIDSVRTMDVYNDLIVMEDGNGTVMVQQITYEDGEYLASNDDIALMSDSNPFSHFYDDINDVLYVSRYDIIDGFVSINIYKYYNGSFVSVYSTSTDESSDMTQLKSSYSVFDDITQTPSMIISPAHDQMILTYVGGVDDVYIVCLRLSMASGFETDEVIVVTPIAGGSSVESYATESRKLIKTMISSDNLILMLEGSETNNKYLQVISL